MFTRWASRRGRLAMPDSLKAMAAIRINGKERTVSADDDIPLLWVLRDELHLTGTKYGCGVAQCGACTVHIDGRAARSCVTPAAALPGRDVVTIEGVSGAVARAVQDAWRALDVAQCGYCQSGQIMSAIALLSEIRRPSDADIDAAMSGNVCRCATYVRIRAAIHEAAKTLGP
jgi:isoquinoline 1-oxidoreductase subunit alpha